jgi:two-component system, NtrC family, sensor kinase
MSARSKIGRKRQAKRAGPAAPQAERAVPALTRPIRQRLSDELSDGAELAIARLEQELETRAEELIQQRHFLEQVVDALPVGLYVVDREYRVQAWNHTRETGLQGIARGGALGRTIFEILHRQSAETLRREFDTVFATGELRQFETESRASSGAGRPPRTYRISKIPLRVTGDEVTHVISVGEDVTSWKEAEARVAQSEKLAAIGQLAAGVMHEINNPLATIAACAESMASQLEPVAHGPADSVDWAALPVAQHIEYLRVIDAEVRRCKGIVEALLDFSRARPVERVMTDLNAVIEQTMFLLKHHHRFRLQPVRLDLAADSAAVHGNAEQLVQVFMALLHNAADALDDQSDAPPAARSMTTRGRRVRPASSSAVGSGAASDAADAAITLRTRRVGRWVVAEVIDGGGGIPRALLSKIFEPFFTTKPPGRGTGLGLSVCYGIVADHGGRMEVESQVGVGSTFRIVLPEADPVAAQGAIGERSLEGVAV